jgi:YbbR domain-containing protein
MNIKSMILHNFWLKVLSLVLAVATWFYVFDLVNRDSHLQKSETAEEVFTRFQFGVKAVPVKPVFTGRTPEGYRVVFDKVKVDPAVIHIFGPEEVIEGVEELRTEKIDLGEYTRSAKLQLGIQPDVKFLKFNEKAVDVYLPVESIPRDKGQKTENKEPK